MNNLGRYLAQLERTSYGLCVFSTLAPGNEHHIALADIRVAILQEEDFIDTIVLKGRELDKYAYWTSQTPLKNQILLSSYL